MKSQYYVRSVDGEYQTSSNWTIADLSEGNLTLRNKTGETVSGPWRIFAPGQWLDVVWGEPAKAKPSVGASKKRTGHA